MMQRREFVGGSGALGLALMLGGCGGGGGGSGSSTGSTAAGPGPAPGPTNALELLAGSLKPPAQNLGPSVDGHGAAASFYLIWSCATDPSGITYVSDGAAIRKVTPQGDVTTIAGIATTGGYQDGTGAAALFGGVNATLAIDLQNNLLVFDYSSGTVRKVTPSGVVTTLIGNTNSATGPNGTIVTANGSLTNISVPGNLQITDIAIDPSGNIFLSALTLILKITPTGQVTTFAGSTTIANTDGIGTQARFSAISSIATDPFGNLYVADGQSGSGPLPTGAGLDASTSCLRMISPSGAVVTIAGGSSGAWNHYGYQNGPALTAQFTEIIGIVADEAGDVYLGDTNNGVIRKLGADGNVSTVVGTVTPTGSDSIPGPLPAQFESYSNLSLGPTGLVIACETGILVTTDLP